jgi:hypothetical protein
LKEIPPQQGYLSTALKERRQVFFSGDGWLDTPIYDRAKLGYGAQADGPLVVEEPTTATVGLSRTDAACRSIRQSDCRNGGAVMAEKMNINPVTLDIVKDSLIAVSNEIFYAFAQTSMSPIIYEDAGLCQRHCGCSGTAG